MSRRLRFSPQAVLAVLILVFLWAPLALVALFSFHKTASLSLPFEGFSLRWYRKVFENPDFVNALKFGLKVSVVVTVLSIAIGVPAAYGIARSRLKAGGAVGALLLLPASVPGIFLGTSLLLFLHKIGIPNSFRTVVIGQLLVVLPLVLLVSRTAFERVDPQLSEVATDLGANPWQVFWKVTFPATWPLIAGAACLSFVISFDEFPVTFFTIGTDSTVPMFVYSMYARQVDPSVNAVSTMLMGTTLLVFALGGLAMLRQRLRDRRNPLTPAVDDGNGGLDGSRA